MKLAQLFSSFSAYKMGENPLKEVSKISIDSRDVDKSTVFVAIQGTHIDSHQFLADVCAKKPVAIVVQDESQVPIEYNGAVLKVAHTRQALQQISSQFYESPTDSLVCIGVTGTNGKTSVTYMVECILNEFGWPCGVLGTIDHHIKDHVWKTSLTTPDAIELNRRLHEMKALGAKAVVFEVSSHALDQQRVDGVNFDVAIYTNLTRDHMDYHKDMPTYFKAKQRLFSEVLLASKKDQTYAVINSDSSYGKQIQVSAKSKTLYYGESADDFKFKITKQDILFTEFELYHQGKTYTVNLPMVGAHNVYNATAAIACCSCLGVSVDSCIKALESFKGVPGRLEQIEINKNVSVFVDYAHTDQALASVLNTLLEIKTEKALPELITVFGCGGDRDKGKRPLMLEAALNFSDKVYLTSDNPRTEDPMAIINDCLTTDKYSSDSSVIIDPDRRSAIKKAIIDAPENAVILIAGKGHEDYQIIGKEKLKFSDIDCIKESLSE